MGADTQSGAAAQRLAGHQPWTHAQTRAYATTELARAERRFRLCTRAVHGLFFLAAMAGGLLLMVNATGKYTGLTWYLAVIAAVAGYAAYHWGMANTPPELRLKHWREESECEALTSQELSELRTLARQLPLAHAALETWCECGVPVQRRDRTVLEGYLRARGVDVPNRAESDWFEQLLASP